MNTTKTSASNEIGYSIVYPKALGYIGIYTSINQTYSYCLWRHEDLWRKYILRNDKYFFEGGRNPSRGRTVTAVLRFNLNVLALERKLKGRNILILILSLLFRMDVTTEFYILFPKLCHFHDVVNGGAEVTLTIFSSSTFWVLSKLSKNRTKIPCKYLNVPLQALPVPK